MFLFAIWLKNKPYIKNLHNWENGVGFIQNMSRCIQGETDITPLMYVQTYTISFHLLS